MDSIMGRISGPLVASLLAACLLVPAGVNGQPPRFPRYDHVFLLIEENEGYSQINPQLVCANHERIGQDYGLATNYKGVADPSEPNYVARSTATSSASAVTDPYWFPGHTVKADNLMHQLERASHLLYCL
jgi:hypothetical protein